MTEIIHTKTCKICNEVKEVNMFRKYRNKCKKCETKTHNRQPDYFKLYYEKNKEKLSKTMKEYHKRKKEILANNSK